MRMTWKQSARNSHSGFCSQECRNRGRMRQRSFLSRTIQFCLISVASVIALLGVTSSSAQVQKREYSTDRSTAVGSRAEQEAEQSVALSPDKIIELLRQEPGLLLQVKKMLVRKAYEQGRILDPEELTDEALFQLLREDHTISALATREIEDRSYVRAKPTQEEIEQQREWNAKYGVARTAAGGTKGSASQEDAYWNKHDDLT